MSNNQALIEFNPKLPKLSKNEKDVLKLLVDAGKLIAPLYLEQEAQAKKGLNKEEIEKASKNNPSLLSHYTVIEKVNGKLVTTPYHIKYAKYLTPIAEKLAEASNLTDNKEFANALRTQAKALLSGSYEQAIATRLKMKPYVLNVSIGPLWYFDDRLMFSKASYQAWIGVVDKEGTDRFNNYKSITLGARRKAFLPKNHIDNLDKVKATVLDVLLFSGLIARAQFVGINLPVEVDIVEKYGSEVTLFNQPNDLRMKESILPTFNKIFSVPFRQGFSTEDLRRGYLRTVALHQLAHSYLYYRDAFTRLQDLFPKIDELAATVLGLRMAGSLLLKDRITNKQLESMIVAFISRGYYNIKAISAANSKNNYSLVGVIFLNFMFENGAIKQSGEIVVPNFMKIFVSLSDLSLILERLLALGRYKDAEDFIKKYTSGFDNLI